MAAEPKSFYWRIGFEVPAENVGAFESALEPHCSDVTSFIAVEGATARVEGYFTAEPDHRAVTTALAVAASALGTVPPKPNVDLMPPKDWVAENLCTFEPIYIGRYFIHGSHFEGRVPSGNVGLSLDAGSAFGSGAHASTQGCLLALDGLARRHRFHNALEVGCGSGILALAMARTWRVPVIAADVDPEAVRVTRFNAMRNRVGALVRPALSDGYRLPVIRRRAPFDLVVCNILANIVCAMARDLARHLEAGGTAVLSGFLKRDGRRVLSAHQRLGFKLVRRVDVGGWHTLVLRR